VWPQTLIQIGLCAQVDYVSDKWDGTVRRYYHEFDLGKAKRPCLLFAAPDPQADGSMLLIIKGHFTIESDGIIG